jgi:predicted MFS family arabinose efflux permease
VTTLVSAVTVLFQVADRAYLPSLAGRDRLAEANTVVSGADAVGESLGPVLMGILVQTLGVPAAILGDALSYVVSAVSLAAIRHPEPPPRSGEAGADGPQAAPSLLDGLRAVARHPLLRPLAGLLATSSLFGGFFAALYEFYVLKTLHLTPAVLGLLITCGGIGSLVGAAVTAYTTRRFGLGPTLLATFAVSAVATALVPAAPAAFAPAFLCLFGAQFGGDLFATIFTIAAATLEQTVTPGAWIGRVEGAMQTLSGGLGVAGALGAGILAAAIGPRDAFWLAAAGNFAATAWLLSPRLRQLGPGSLDSAAWADSVALGPSA